MDTQAARRLQILGLISLWLLHAAVPGADASYSIGVGRADTTGPTAEVVFVGIPFQTPTTDSFVSLVDLDRQNSRTLYKVSSFLYRVLKR